MSAQKSSELEIKAEVLNVLRDQSLISRHSLLASEFRMGSSSLRADLAIFGDQFIGIEVKSGRDSLRRLASQLDGYVSYFDRIVVVMASKHLLSLDETTLASNVGICEFDVVGRLKVFREPTHILPPRKSMLDLLTLEERRKFELSLPPHIRGDEVARTAAEREYFRSGFARRFSKTSEQFWETVGRRKVQASDLENLSRFAARRRKLKLTLQQQAAKWEEWHLNAERYFSDQAPR